MGWSLEASEAGITNIRKLTGDNSKFQGHESGLSMTLDNSEASKIIGSLSNNIKIDFDSKGLPPHNPDRQKSLM
jgi:5,10-methylenetetrahydrofolate reductase